jgi:hypothetical protein
MPPIPAIAANAARAANDFSSMSGKGFPEKRLPRMFSTPPDFTGTVPNRKKPVRMSIHVSRLE